MTRKGSGVRVPHGPPDSLVRGGAGTDGTVLTRARRSRGLAPPSNGFDHVEGEVMGSASGTHGLDLPPAETIAPAAGVQSVITHTTQTAIIDSAAANWTRAARPKPVIVARIAR
jgi:hypothetical protein